jgi:uncharacterized protein
MEQTREAVRDAIAHCIRGEKLRVRVRPSSQVSELLAVDDGVPVLAIAAPPEDGKANREVERFLSRTLKRQVHVKSGFTSREKVVVVR